MFRLNHDFFEYLKDLSNPDFSSSSAIEAYKEKKKIVRLVLVTFVLGTIVLGAGVMLLMLNLPGLFNVTFEILGALLAYLVLNWPLFLIFCVFFVVFIFLYLRS